MRAKSPNPQGKRPWPVLVAVLLFAGFLLHPAAPSLGGPVPGVEGKPGHAYSILWDFESGPQGFWGTGDWEWGAPNGGGPASAHSGSYCWGTDLKGPYSAQAYCHLYFPAIVVLSESAELRFASWYQFEEGIDGGQVAVSTDGSNWTLLEPVGGYPGEIELPSGKLVPAFTGFSEGWEEPTFDLGPYVGQTIYLQCKLMSDAWHEMSGWFLDDVQLLNVVTAYTAGVDGREDKSGGLPGGDSATGLSVLDMSPAFPNPFREGTSFRFVVPDGAGTSDARLEILSVTGRVVTVVADGKQAVGEHVLFWDGRDSKGRAVPAGVYFAHLVVADREATRRIIRME
jgi:hypothetical protein